MLSPAVRMLAIGVFSSCVTGLHELRSQVGELRAGARSPQRQQEADRQRHRGDAGNHEGRAAALDRLGQASGRRRRPPPRSTAARRDRRALPCATRPGRRRTAGTPGASSARAGRRRTCRRHARRARRAPRAPDRPPRLADPGDLARDLREVGCAHPLEVDREAEHALELLALRVPVQQARHHLVARPAEQRSRRPRSGGGARRRAGCAASSRPATTGSYSTITGKRFGPAAPGIHAGRRSDRFRKTTAAGAAAPRQAKNDSGYG